MAVVVEHDTRREGLEGVIERVGVKDARLVHVIPFQNPPIPASTSG